MRLPNGRQGKPGLRHPAYPLANVSVRDGRQRNVCLHRQEL